MIGLQFLIFCKSYHLSCERNWGKLRLDWKRVIIKFGTNYLEDDI